MIFESDYGLLEVIMNYITVIVIYQHDKFCTYFDRNSVRP